ncbi:MAG: PQQ-dependent sugar dehydrogenase [Chromatiales bacterium]|nr:PQQ-dependent sugar dehydrogenase [Chromatiales bacterium]
MKKLSAACLCASLLAASAPSSALDAKLELVAQGLTAPLLLVSPPDGSKRRFVIEQIGLVKIMEPDGTILDEPFLNIRHKLADLLSDFDEEGLLGLAFHPDYKTNGKFYVSYSGRLRGDADLGAKLWYAHTNYVAEYTVSKDNPDKADGLSERIVTQIDWPQFNHNGHWIGFGPDGYLYISTGDGGYANDWGIGHHVTKGNGQDMGSLNGKILRIDVNGERPYAVPKDNPFVGRNDAAPEIWAYGFRNPWRCSFDMGGTNELFCGDVGQNSFEEIDIVTKGGNYGWRMKEGTHCFDYVNPNQHPASCDDAGMIDPIIEYNNCNVTENCKGISVTGGYVYRGAHQAWQGKYFFGDWSKSFAVKDGRLYVASKAADGKWAMEDVNVVNQPGWNSYVLAFGQDGDGEIYVMATDTTGPVGGLDRIYRLTPP